MSDDPIRVDSRAWTGDATLSPSDVEDIRAEFKEGEVVKRVFAVALVSSMMGAPVPPRLTVTPRDPEELLATFKKRFPRVVLIIVAAVLGVLICFAAM